MNQFSISQLAQFSGIKPHTIRIWEQRYNALQPKRSEGNTRYYDGQQLRRLLNIVSLSKTKYKVSKLCKMTDEELASKLEDHFLVAEESGDYAYFVSRLIGAGMNYDETNFSRIFSHCLLKFGLEKTYTQVVYPVMNRIGLMWSSNVMPPSQEHYISNLVRQKLFTAIDGVPESEGSRKWILFLPENEFHEIGLLFSYYFIRQKGEQVIYLGANVPLSSLEDCLRDTGAEHILLFMVHQDLPENISEYLRELTEIAKDQSIHVACKKDLIEKVSYKKGAYQWVHGVEDLEVQLEQKHVGV